MQSPTNPGGFTSQEIIALIQAGFTPSQLAALVKRMADAQQNGTDAYGLTTQQLHDLVIKILQKLNDPNPEVQLEGETARLLIASVTGIEVRRDVGTASTRYDVETGLTLLEVTNSSGAQKGSQIETYIQTDAAHYHPARPIVFYAPNMNAPRSISYAQEAHKADVAHNLNVPVYIIGRNGVWEADGNGWTQIIDTRITPMTPEQMREFVLKQYCGETIA